MNAHVKIADEGMTHKERAFYDEGRKARRAGKPADACSSINLVLFSYFRAGWHDQDYELGNRIYNGPERPRRSE